MAQSKKHGLQPFVHSGEGRVARSMFLFCSAKSNMSRKIPMAAMLALAGCDQIRNSGDCITAPTITQSVAETGPGAASRKLDGCIKRWSYRLARAPGSNTEIAEAVIGGCSDGLEGKAQEYFKLQYGDGPEKLADVHDALYAEVRKDALEQAKFYVALGRAAKCTA